MCDLCLGVFQEGRWADDWLHGVAHHLSSRGWLGPAVCPGVRA